jgi:hypothetical protein
VLPDESTLLVKYKGADRFYTRLSFYLW